MSKLPAQNQPLLKKGLIRRQLHPIATMPVQLQRMNMLWATILAAIAVGYALVGALWFTRPGECEKSNALICGVYTGVASIVLVAVLGLGAFVTLTLHIRRGYLRRAESEAGSVFPGIVAAYDDQGFVVNSLQVRRAIERTAPTSRWLRPGRLEHVPPQVVLGQAGEGKTRMLVQLTEELARDGFVPIPVSLRNLRSFDSFLSLGRDAFQRAVESQLASAEEGDRIWRWMCWSGRLVVLADDLQLLHGETRDGLEKAFLEAERSNYALVVTSRRDGLPPRFDRWVVPISQPDRGQALELIRSQDAPPDPEFDTFALSLIDAGQLNESRYYLWVLKRLRNVRPSTRTARQTNRRFAVRTHVLEMYVEAYIDGLLPCDDAPQRSERAMVIQELGRLSYEALLKGAEVRVENVSSPMSSALQAGLMRGDGSEVGVLEHALLQSYLASRVIDAGQAERLVRNDAGTPEARDALLFYAGSDTDVQRANSIVSSLLREADNRPAFVSLVITAADIAATANIDHGNKELVDALGSGARAAGRHERLAIVDRLARIRGGRAIEEIWKSGERGDYRVTWALAGALVGTPTPPRLTSRDRAVSAAHVLEGKITDCIQAGRDLIGGEPQDDWVPTIMELKRIGWLLPTLMVATPVTSSQSPIMRALDELLDLFDLRAPPPDEQPRLAKLTEQVGPEASIAQGLKAAARLVAWDLPTDPAGENVRELAWRLRDLYGRARFWYSRLVLLQGMADLLIAIGSESHLDVILSDEAAVLSNTLKDASRCSPCGRFSAVIEGGSSRAGPGHEHAFVVEAARLCLTAVETATARHLERSARESRDQFVWDDEGVALGRPAGLGTEALLLLGDVAILLNLNEKGNLGRNLDVNRTTKSDRELRASFGENDYLPDCLCEGSDRWAKLGQSGNGCTCAFERCPYAWSTRRANREFSKMFCARMVDEVQVVPPWQQGMSTDSYRRFWLEMEQHATYMGA